MSGFLSRLGLGRRQDPAAAVAAAAAQRAAATPPAEGGRGARTVDPARYGMPPREALRTDLIRPLPAVAAARDAARQGDWKPAASLFEQVGRDWELRYLCTTLLAETAAEEDGWLLAWREARPQDAAAATVQARALVDLAWQLRGSGWAREVSREQWEGFHRVLGQAPDACLQAAALAPEDPTPWIVHLAVAMGLSYGNEDFRALWAEVVSRAPYHVKAHLSAQNYWLPRWKGSRELVTGFVEEAIAGAPRGSLLTLLRLDLLNNELRPADKAERPAFWRSEDVRRAVDAGLEDLAAADPGHLRIDSLRGWLAYFLNQSGRHAEAVDLFRQIGVHVATEPWSYSADGTSLFVANRTEALLGWEDAGRPALPDGRSPLEQR